MIFLPLFPIFQFTSPGIVIARSSQNPVDNDVLAGWDKVLNHKPSPPRIMPSLPAFSSLHLYSVWVFEPIPHAMFSKARSYGKVISQVINEGLYAPLLKQHRKIEKYRVALTFSRFSLKSLIKHSEHFTALTFAPLSQSAGHSCISKMKSGSKRRSAYSPHGLTKFSLQPHVQIAV